MRLSCRLGAIPMGSMSKLEVARKKLREVCDEVEQRLAAAKSKAPAEGYLSGAHFGAYDLAFCALAAFAVLPPETTSCVEASSKLKQGTLPVDGIHMKFVNEFRNRPA